MYYIGLDIHKKSISFCVKDADGQIYQQGKVAATRPQLDVWMKTLPQPWMAAMEATIFTGWIYDHLKPQAAAVKVAHQALTVRRILELANKAHFLYLTRNHAERGQLLKTVLSNCTTNGVNLTPTYRKPFDLIFQRAKNNEEWWAL